MRTFGRMGLLAGFIVVVVLSSASNVDARRGVPGFFLFSWGGGSTVTAMSREDLTALMDELTRLTDAVSPGH